MGRRSRPRPWTPDPEYSQARFFYLRKNAQWRNFKRFFGELHAIGFYGPKADFLADAEYIGPVRSSAGFKEYPNKVEITVQDIRNLLQAGLDVRGEVLDALAPDAELPEDVAVEGWPAFVAERMRIMQDKRNEEYGLTGGLARLKERVWPLVRGKEASLRDELRWVSQVLALDPDDIDEQTCPSQGAYVAYLGYVRRPYDFWRGPWARMCALEIKADVKAGQAGDAEDEADVEGLIKRLSGQADDEQEIDQSALRLLRESRVPKNVRTKLDWTKDTPRRRKRNG